MTRVLLLRGVFGFVVLVGCGEGPNPHERYAHALNKRSEMLEPCGGERIEPTFDEAIDAERFGACGDRADRCFDGVRRYHACLADRVETTIAFRCPCEGCDESELPDCGDPPPDAEAWAEQVGRCVLRGR